MRIIFELNENDKENIELIKSAGFEIEETSHELGFSGAELIALAGVLSPIVIKLIEQLSTQHPVSMKLHTKMGLIELSASNEKELSKVLEKLKAFLPVDSSDENADDGKTA